MFGQITVYIGKRDFIDYLSHIDPIGKICIGDDTVFMLLLQFTTRSYSLDAVSIALLFAHHLFMMSAYFFVAKSCICHVSVSKKFQNSVVCSLLWAGVQPALDPSAETFMSVQCTSPERGGELVGVCGVCASCVVWRKA